MVNPALFLASRSFIVWAHHRFIIGMGTTMSSFFQFTTRVISIPSTIIITTFHVRAIRLERVTAGSNEEGQ